MALYFLSGEYGVSTSARAEYSGQNVTLAIWIKGEPGSDAATGSIIAAAADADSSGGRAGLALASRNWFGTGDSIAAHTLGDFWGDQSITHSAGAGGEDDTWTLWTFRSTTDFTTTASHQLWKNGAQNGSTNTDHRRRYPGSNLKAGVMCDPADPTDTAFHNNGKTLAHFAIWSSYLSDADIASLASGDNPMVIDEANLVDYWPLLTDGENLVDAANPLIITGTPDEDADNPTVDDPPAGGGPTIITVTAAGVGFTGQTVGIIAPTLIDITTASSDMTPQTVSILESSIIPVEAGSISKSGQALKVSESFPITSGEIDLTAQTVGLNASTNLLITASSLTHSGQSITVQGSDVIAILAASVVVSAMEVEVDSFVIDERIRNIFHTVLIALDDWRDELDAYIETSNPIQDHSVRQLKNYLDNLDRRIEPFEHLL